jgi:hypothetical protein
MINSNHSEDFIPATNVPWEEDPIPSFQKEKQKKEAKKELELTLEEVELTDFQRNLIQCFDAICLPFSEGTGDKEDKFFELLDGHGIEYVEKIGMIIPTVDGSEPKKVVVSHMDLIPLFNKGFKNGRKYTFSKDEKDEFLLVGALDNTITNAFLILAILELREQGLAQDVEFVFTEGEEIDFLGMKEYLRTKSKKPFFINLDVTNDNWKKYSSIEYDYPSFHICKQIKKGLQKPGFQKDRVGDDFDAIKAVGGKGFSYCLPTDRNIHSYKNTTHLSKLEPYYEGLKFLITELDVEEQGHSIVYHSIKKALEHNDFEKFKKAEKQLKKVQEKKAKKAEAKRAKEREKWRNSGSSTTTGRTYSGQHQQHGLDFGDDFYTPTEKRFYDSGRGLQSEDDYLGYDRTPQGFNDGYDFYENGGMITSSDIIELDSILNSSMVALADYDLDPSEEDNIFIRKFVADHIFAQDQWTTDDLAGFIGDLDKALKVVVALDDYYLIETIEEGVYEFVKHSPYA